VAVEERFARSAGCVPGLRPFTLGIMARLTTLGFDADDTLWHNETIFAESHRRYCELLGHYHDAATVERHLYATEMRNLPLFGYGIKAHALSSIETAIELTRGEIRAEEIRAILELAREMLEHPVELIDGASTVVPELARRYRLLLLTKGDLLDQERKVEKSGLAPHFDHVEVLSDKKPAAYARLLERLGIDPSEFLMVGNSMKSDILPVLALGGHAVFVPYAITWQHEEAEPPAGAIAACFHQVDHLRDLPALLERLEAENA
jgi:putative hydrolase of the HAD superfamily